MFWIMEVFWIQGYKLVRFHCNRLRFQLRKRNSNWLCGVIRLRRVWKVRKATFQLFHALESQFHEFIPTNYCNLHLRYCTSALFSTPTTLTSTSTTSVTCSKYVFVIFFHKFVKHEVHCMVYDILKNQRQQIMMNVCLRLFSIITKL